MGFWVNGHPGFSSPCSILEEIKADVNNNYQKDPAILTKFGMPAGFTPPDMYLARGRISGQYHEVSPTGQVQKMPNLDTGAMLTYATFPAPEILSKKPSHQLPNVHRLWPH
jgi:hypothetical protein